MTEDQPGSRARRGQQDQDAHGHDDPPAGRALPSPWRAGLDPVRARAGKNRDLAGLIRLGGRRIRPEQAVEEIVGPRSGARSPGLGTALRWRGKRCAARGAEGGGPAARLSAGCAVAHVPSAASSADVADARRGHWRQPALAGSHCINYPPDLAGHAASIRMRGQRLVQGLRPVQEILPRRGGRARACGRRLVGDGHRLTARIDGEAGGQGRARVPYHRDRDARA